MERDRPRVRLVLAGGHASAWFSPFWRGPAPGAQSTKRYQIDQLQITNPQVIPHGVGCEGLLRVLSWVGFDLPDHYKRTLSTLLRAAGEGCLNLHMVPIEGRDIRDDPIATENDVPQVLIDMIPTPGKGDAEGGGIIQKKVAEFLRGFSLRTLIFLLDMVLPQLDAYHAGRQLQHLQPWVSVELAQQHLRGQAGSSVSV